MARRREAWLGIAAAALLLAAFAIPGTPPSPGAPASELAAFLDDRRGALLASSALIALGNTLYVWFLAAVAAWLRDAGSAAIALVATGATGSAILVAGGGLLSALVLQSAGEGEGLVRYGFDAYNSLVTIAGAPFGAAVAAAALAGARAGALPRWLVGAAAVVVPLQFATLVGLATADGFFAAGGGMALIAFWALAAWWIAVAVRMIRADGPREAG